MQREPLEPPRHQVSPPGPGAEESPPTKSEKGKKEKFSLLSVFRCPFRPGTGGHGIHIPPSTIPGKWFISGSLNPHPSPNSPLVLDGQTVTDFIYQRLLIDGKPALGRTPPRVVQGVSRAEVQQPAGSQPAAFFISLWDQRANGPMLTVLFPMFVSGLPSFGSAVSEA